MKINFTKSEYHLLVEMLTVADWVMHEGRDPQELKFEKQRELRNKIFSFYKEFDAKNILEPDSEKNEFYQKIIRSKTPPFRAEGAPPAKPA